MKELLERLKRSKPYRVWDRYGAARGNLLAGGIAYVALFSMFPVLAIGFTVFGLVLGGNTDLQNEVVDYINEMLGTEVIGPNGIVTMETLIQPTALNITAVIGIVGLLFTGLGWVNSLRQGIRAVFGLQRLPSPVLKKLIDIGVLLVMGLLVLSSVVVSLVLSSASDWALDLVGLNSSWARLGVQVLVEVGVLVVDVGLFLVFFLAVARVRVPVRALLSGAVIGAVGLHALKWASGLLMRQASNNAFLASAAILVGLLLFFNLVSRLTLLAASWASVTTSDLGLHPAELDEAATDEPQPAASRAVAPAEVEPTVTTRSGDRVALAAGAVLGGAVVAGAGLVGRAARTVVDAGRGAVGPD